MRTSPKQPTYERLWRLGWMEPLLPPPARLSRPPRFTPARPLYGAFAAPPTAKADESLVRAAVRL